MLAQLSGAVMRRVAKVERARTWGEVGIVVMADEGIRRVNHSFLGHNRPTDVISFAYPPLPGADAWSGEVVVNVQRAVEAGRYWQARRAGWSPAHELALYVAHGCHHLSGADDATPVERRRMRAKELRWLRELEAEGCRLEALIANTEMKRPCW